MMNTKAKKKQPQIDVKPREITEGNTGEPFGGNTATKPSRVKVKPVKGKNSQQDPFGLVGKVPQRSRREK